MLNDVLYAPAGANLIAISAATNRGSSFNFAGDNVMLNGTIVGTKVGSALHQAILSPVEKAYVPTNCHERLGHASETAIRAASKVYGFQPEDATSCDCCQKGKAVKIINQLLLRLRVMLLVFFMLILLGHSQPH